jgi:magnesium transporter
MNALVLDLKKKKLVESNSFKKLKKFISRKEFIVWVDLTPKEKELKELQETFGFHALEIEDCKKFTALPKMDEFEDHLFLIFHRVFYDFETHHLSVKEVNFFLGKNYLVSVHQESLEKIKEMKKKIKANPLLMKSGPDLVMHEILDLFIDDYLPIIDHWDEVIEKLEEKIIEGQTKGMLKKITRIKRNIAHFKKSISPQRDILNKLIRRDSRFISEKAVIYYRDIYDHLMRAYNSLEANRDLITSVFEAYLSMISNEMNKIMQRLTIVATIFMPLTLIAGIYGMNFHYMPELSWEYGYFAVLLGMVFVGTGMWIYFSRKRMF